MTPHSSLLPLVRKYFEDDPVRAAHSLEAMDEEDAVNVLKALPVALSAEAFPHLQVNHAVALLKEVPPQIFNGIIERIDAQQGAAIFMNLPADARKRLLEGLPEKTKKQIQELLTFPENSAGRIMSTNFLAFHSDLKVNDVIQKIRSLVKKRSPISYAYVVDGANQLTGVINMRDLMLADGQMTLQEVMRKDVFTVDGFMDRESLAQELSKRGFFAAPVVDAEKHLIGVVRVEQLIEDVQEEASEDMQKMFGAGGDERAGSPVVFSLAKRLPWLHVNLVTAFLAAGVIALFEDVIAKITALAVFLPVVAGQGGNAGAQSLAVVMRGIVMREIPASKAGKIVFKEAAIGFVNGIVIGLVTAGIAWLWKGNPYFGVVIGLAMLVNLTVAGFSGAAIPMMMKAVGLDPAQCSNIILTTITDVVGFLAFLGFAVLFSPHLT